MKKSALIITIPFLCTIAVADCLTHNLQRLPTSLYDTACGKDWDNPRNLTGTAYELESTKHTAAQFDCYARVDGIQLDRAIKTCKNPEQDAIHNPTIAETRRSVLFLFHISDDYEEQHRIWTMFANGEISVYEREMLIKYNREEMDDVFDENGNFVPQ